VHVLHNEPLRKRNTLALSAVATHFVSVTGEGELLQALAWAKENDKNVVVLGQGSNIVLAGDLDALVVVQAGHGIEVIGDNGEEVTLKVAAGENWHALVEWTLTRGYFGLENLALIPGTVGAAPIQNIGAYGVEIAPFVRRVHAIEVHTLEPLALNGGECEFAYRDSIFKRSLRDKVVITALELVLSRKPEPQPGYPVLQEYLETNGITDITPQALFDAVVSIRKTKLPDPAVIPNAGSFFKNPVLTQRLANELVNRAPGIPCYRQADGKTKVPAAWLIEKCGWKGMRVGEVGVHPEHALVLVNYESEGEEDGTRLLALASDIATSVLDTYGVVLEIEPRVYGL